MKTTRRAIRNDPGALVWLACLFCLPLASVRPCTAEDWEQWRGRDGNAVSTETGLPVAWSATMNVDWRTTIDGEGSSSPIVSNERVFVTSSFDFGRRRAVHCLDALTGDPLWSREIEDQDPEISSSLTGHAAATPAASQGCVVACFGRAGVVCYDFSGNRLWHVNLGPFESELGLASSPRIEGQRVFLICDHDGDLPRSFDSYLLALNLADGSTAWKVDRPGLYRSWSSPIVVRVGERQELIVNAQDELRAYDPDAGGLLWRVRGQTGWVTPSPVSGLGLVFADSGKAGPVMAVRPGGTGDVTESRVVWQVDGAGPYVCSPLLYQEWLYVHGEQGVLTCYEARSGRVAYRQRLDGKFYASGVAGDGKLYLTNEAGTTYVIQSGGAFELVGENSLEEETLASPALSGRRLFLRTRQHLYCIAPGAG